MENVMLDIDSKIEIYRKYLCKFLDWKSVELKQSDIGVCSC